MQTSYAAIPGEWQVHWPQRISQHDLVYQSPIEDPMHGIPIGNGDLGAILWTEPERLMVAINKVDTWDDRSSGPAAGWDRRVEEQHTSLRHGARLVVDFGQPLFDLLYQQRFEGRLQLAEATARIESETPFAQTHIESYASHEAGLLVLDVAVRCAGTETAPLQVRLERWGSRTFAHWYRQIRRDPAMGLEGTESSVAGERILIRQQLTRLHFVVAAQLLPLAGEAPPPRRLHSRAAAYLLPAAPQIRFRLFLTLVTSENAADPTAEAHRRLDEAIAGQAAVRAAHLAAWRRFWEASFLSLPQKYLENIWHLVLYFANSSSRGAYPPHFCNGLWGWNRDFVPWNYYFHWNMQWYVWPLHPANHAELAAPYFRYRSQQLAQAQHHAQERLDRLGAFYADVADRNGFNDPGLSENHTPGPQIALDFWRHYRYTGDEHFLRSQAWPVIREVTHYLTSYLYLAEDGHFHISGGSAYEGTQAFTDTVTDLAMAAALLPVAIAAARLVGEALDQIPVWQEQLQRLIPIHLEPLRPDELEQQDGQPVLRGGLGKGQSPPLDQVPAVGRRPQDGRWVRMRHAGYETDYYGIPDPELAPIFPAGIVGLAHPDAELFQAGKTHLLAHPPAVPDPAQEHRATMRSSGELCMGWCPYPIALARLGMAEQLRTELEQFVSTWQFYPQGFGHYGPYHVYHQDYAKRWRVNRVDDADRSRHEEQLTIPFPTWPFRHFSNEAMPIVATTLNEMLLQSHEGAIRICPATPADWAVRFSLQAQGGFTVSVQRSVSAVEWVWLSSRDGGDCRIVHPWPGQEQIWLYELAEATGTLQPIAYRTLSGRILACTTTPGGRYLLSPTPTSLTEWQLAPEEPQTNQEPRTLGNAVLGSLRMY